jgi:predicted transcriptional regulator
MSTGQIGLLISIVAAFQAALVIWVKASIEGAVKHQWDRDLEEFKYEMRRREQAAMIAELLAEWDSKSSDRKRLNQLVLEANLWLPESIARELNRVLSYHADAKSSKELVIDIRHLLQGEKDSLLANEIVYFPPPAI